MILIPEAEDILFLVPQFQLQGIKRDWPYTTRNVEDRVLEGTNFSLYSQDFNSL